jgi:hypothetical protein
MLTFLITVPPGLTPRGANQMRQQLDIKEHFRRGNAPLTQIVALQGGLYARDLRLRALLPLIH